MTSTLVQRRPTTLSAISLPLAVPLLFSLLGLTLTATILPFLSNQTINLIFTSMSVGGRLLGELNRAETFFATSSVRCLFTT